MKRQLLIAMSATAILAVNASALTLESDDLCPCGRIPARFTAEGRNTSPQLEIGDIPPGTKSLAIVMDDPDASSGLFTHWLLWNIPPGTTHIASASTPAGTTTGSNDFGTTTYRGPQPPSGTHRYHFHVFALDRQLDLPAGSDRKTFDKAIKDHVIASATLEGTFSKRKK